MKLSAALWLSMAVAASGARAHEVATSADSALNLLDATDFFVCGAAVPGLSGHYVRSDEVQSDEHTPVFVREDEGSEESSALVADAHDFRLYRHNGFWLLADVAAWPPKTHFRCDPTKRDIDGVNTHEACSMFLGTPPRVGYSPVDPAQAPLELQDHDCFGAGGSPFATPRSEL